MIQRLIIAVAARPALVACGAEPVVDSDDSESLSGSPLTISPGSFSP